MLDKRADGATAAASSLTWIHLSDWHQRVNEDGSADDPEAEPVLVALRNDIEERRLLQLQGCPLDFAVFSGDTANTGNLAEFIVAYDGLFRTVIDTSGVDEQRVLVVAGNHDLQDNAICDPDKRGLKLPAKCFPGDWYDRSLWNEWLKDRNTRDHLRQPFADFRQFAQTRLGIHDADWVYSRDWNLNSGAGATLRLHVVCLNSALFCRRRPRPDRFVTQHVGGSTRSFKIGFDDYGDLFVGEPQLEEGLQGVPETGFYDRPRALRIAVLHHPVSWLLQPERVDTRNRLIERFDFVLTGHEHEQRVIEESGTQGRCLFIPAGPAFDRRSLRGETPGDTAYPYALAYNIVRLDLQTGEGLIYLRRYDRAKRRFVAGYESRFARGEYRFRLPEPEIPERSVAEETPPVKARWNEP